MNADDTGIAASAHRNPLPNLLDRTPARTEETAPERQEPTPAEQGRGLPDPVGGGFRDWIALRHPFPAGSLRAVLFDFDHTLSDTVLSFPEMRRKGLEALARFAPVAADCSLPLMEQMAGILASLSPATAAEAEKAALDVVKEVEIAAARRSALFPFARPVLAALRARGTAAAVITRNCPEAVYAVFPDLDDYCACVLTREHVKHVKPHPEHIGTALERLGCAARQALTVGDHVMDIEAGKRAGTRTAAVLTGDSDLAELAGADPDITAPDAGALLRGLGMWRN
ncbi:MAG: HAD-IA family hydrolase [Desulfovibrio sp.]|nr:HAD-IA family hydrolase [Desulfovibrio sp.]